MGLIPYTRGIPLVGGLDFGPLFAPTPKARAPKPPARGAARVAKVRRATPPWADRGAIRAIYRDARARGLEVDHIVPLDGTLVCGLHVAWNLRAVPRAENARKAARTWPGMPEIQLEIPL